MRKRWGIFWMALCVILALAGVPDTVWAASGKVSVSVSSGNINIGDTVTVTVASTGPGGGTAYATMTLTYDASILQFVSCSEGVYVGGGGSVIVSKDRFTVTLRAISAGTSALNASGIDGVDFASGEEFESMTGSSTSVTVNNAASAGGGTGTGTGGGGGTGTGTGGGGTGTGTGGGGGTGTGTGTGGGTAALSADNSLKSLTISPGTLSPAFSGSTTSYSATVGNDVTSIAVSAVPANSKAIVESVTGNDNLQVGSNTIRIVVKAENGVTATYTINVTRQSAGGATAPESDPETEPDPQPDPGDEQDAVTVNGVRYWITEDFEAEDIPADFTESTIYYHGNEYRGVSFDKGSLQLLWMKTAEAGGRFFVYDNIRDGVYSFVRLGSAERYVIALLAPVDASIPENYLQTSLMLDGGDVITAYQRDDTTSEIASDFYLFYGVNHEGMEGWYQYDAREGTYQRIDTTEVVTVVEEETFDASAELEALGEEYAELSAKYSQERAFARNTIALLVFVAAVLLIIIINLLIARFRGRSDTLDEEELEDDDPTEEYEDDEPVEEEEPQAEEPVEEEPEDEGSSAEPEDEEQRKHQRRRRGRKKEKEKGKGDLEVIDFNDL